MYNLVGHSIFVVDQFRYILFYKDCLCLVEELVSRRIVTENKFIIKN